MSATSTHACGLIALAILAILTILCVHVNSEPWIPEAADVQYGSLDCNVTLACSSSLPRSLAEWRLNGSTPVPGQTGLGLDGGLTLVNTTQHMEGIYSCHDEEGNVVHAVKLYLGRAPEPLNVSCRMVNHHVVRCFWKPLVNTYLPSKYIATYRYDNHVKTCHQEPSKPNECTIGNPPMWYHTVTMNITEVNPLGTASTRIQLQFHKLLRPDPPEAVTLEPVAGQPRKLRVSWRYPSSWPQGSAFPLHFQLRYRPVGSNIWSERITTGTTVMITDMVSGHPHLIQVQAGDELSFGSWSEWSPELLALPWIVEASPTTKEDPAYELFTEPITIEPTELPVEKTKGVGVLVCLGLLAGVILLMLCTLIILLWVRQKRRDCMMKRELASMMSMQRVKI
ncbi:interleukin-11 receptor subunit alpha isoform X1 [Paramormyrops kingsleyae]|uniref:interleukin-11 receptor subunit alpha isoform X1 n=1 Tax=Paramormyrops kingsleyae TaxID=1676925 RepID=UPI000CD5EE7A|nr:interleukin-11 receptor subunit alpha-like isoform X1 [Paramormyrops kingsleyae]XP_023664196.1 interleukin-11 receptor subunit alpha-like isoform X1 [Paramormyrops kingsleyae]XP_023664197.1 interleukin-11 receptor subunit alpha-like isoform X1 [Paramormyrops kingsleyae]XP_023664198.1 interleukin-11 receptor subunit alpha-like isoform X1 [Paramormyrops kingsleyae]XP_023664199.1 interleukin-11 receptor subunit alpha-like isoform X1 [Paramormyrops kingsleyae]